MRLLFTLAATIATVMFLNAGPSEEAMATCQQTYSFSVCHQMLN